jgi:hypothetical protein
MFFTDGQQELNFLIEQLTYIEPKVDEVLYPEIQYPALIPVDFSANEWAKSITYFSSDKAGQAQWFNGYARDVPRADVSMNKYETGVSMAAIGYGFTIEELAQAAMLPGPNRLKLDDARANAARFAYEKFVDQALMFGDTTKNYSGLINNAAVTAMTAAATGTSGATTWASKTPDQWTADINTAISGIYTTTNTVEWADTVLLPISRLLTMADTPRNATNDNTPLEFLSKGNAYTAITGKPLTIRGVRGLDTAGAGGTARLIAYRRSPDVLKAHIPMRHKFLPPMRTGPILYEVPGIFRFGGLDIKRPASVRYVDGI